MYMYLYYITQLLMLLFCCQVSKLISLFLAAIYYFMYISIYVVLLLSKYEFRPSKFVNQTSFCVNLIIMTGSSLDI